MDSLRDKRHRIAAAAQADRFFETYEIEMSPEEALSFTATAAADVNLTGITYALVDALNCLIPSTDFGPNHPRTGLPHHRYRVGRRGGDRLIILEIFKGYLKPEYPMDDLIEVIGKQAEKCASSFHWESDENMHHFTFLWNNRGDR